MTTKKSIGTALIVAGLASGLSGFRLHSVAWMLGGVLLVLIGLLLLRPPTLSVNPDSADSDLADPGGLGYLGGLGDLDDSGGLDDSGDAGASGDGYASSADGAGDSLDLPSIDFDN